MTPSLVLGNLYGRPQFDSKGLCPSDSTFIVGSLYAPGGGTIVVSCSPYSDFGGEVENGLDFSEEENSQYLPVFEEWLA